MEYTFLPKEIGIEFKINNVKHIIKVGMKIPEVEAIIGKPYQNEYHTKKYNPNEKYLYKSKEQWAATWGKAKRAVYNYETALVLNYRDDILEYISITRPAKAYLDGKNLLVLNEKQFLKFMKERGYERVMPPTHGETFKIANITVDWGDPIEGPEWVAILDTSKD